MSHARLTLALEAGLEISSSPVALFCPPSDLEIPEFNAANICVFHNDLMAFEKWKSRGLKTVSFDDVAAASKEYVGSFEQSFVFMPRSKDFAAALIAAASEMTTGPVVVDGQKTDGIETALKTCRKICDVVGTISKSHGKLFWVNAADGLKSLRPDTSKFVIDGMRTAPGVFSATKVDIASALLAAALPEDLGKCVADFGAGWGYLTREILKRNSVERVELVEANKTSIGCAQLNISDPRANFHWADATFWTSLDPLDSVVMNPPFHSGRAATPELGQAFIRNAAKNMKGSGALYLVANKNLPYENVLAECFRRIDPLPQHSGFKLIRASQPTTRKR